MAELKLISYYSDYLLNDCLPRESKWYEPCGTEYKAFHVHKFALDSQFQSHNSDEFYVALPWATCIDFTLKGLSSENQQQHIQRQIRFAKARIASARRNCLYEQKSLKVHTVCQHVYWREFLDVWASIGITDLWLSHCPRELAGSVLSNGITLHPWTLYAVNIEDSARTNGLEIAKPVQSRKLLASFSGAHLDFYISDVRDRLPLLNAYEGFEVFVNTQWHFEAQVTALQAGDRTSLASAVDSFAVESYNRQLSDSVFALCPSGSGPNTIRLWEALAVGTIPVLMGVIPALPTTAEVTEDLWKRTVLVFEDDNIHSLPAFLAQIGPEERLERHLNAMRVYQLLRNLTCF